MVIAYKTGDDNILPQEKYRIWFCCHPKDLADYFESTSQEILRKQDCTIYYDKNPEQDFNTEELLSNLEEINLFVMPVSSRLLTTENRAIDLEFPYAMQKNIPVLPIIQEEGIEKLFNQRCGNLHALNKWQADETAISYDEKLTRFLNAVFSEENLVKKVRSQFNICVFISYRKKDRRFAKRLMELVHSDSKYREISIYYDEFLVPGRPFPEAIKHAIHKSDLFALVLTENVNEEGNYVMKHEYPEARDSGKPIAPFDMVHLSDELWQSITLNFPGIPSRILPDQADNLKLHLEQWFGSLSEKDYRENAERSYLLGTAYLYGILREVNYDFALELTKHASDLGLLEATMQLANMYYCGNGVEQNIWTALKYQLDVVQKIRGNQHNDSDKNALISELTKLADIYLTDPLEHDDPGSGSFLSVKKGIVVLSEVVELQDTLRRDGATEYSTKQHIRNLSRLSRLLSSQIRLLVSSECFYEKAVRTTERWIALSMQYPELGYSVADALYCLAQLYHITGRVDRQKEQLLKIIENKRDYAKNTGVVYQAYKDIIDMHISQGDYMQVRTYILGLMKLSCNSDLKEDIFPFSFLCDRLVYIIADFAVSKQVNEACEFFQILKSIPTKDPVTEMVHIPFFQEFLK